MKAQRFLPVLFLLCLLGGNAWVLPARAATSRAPLACSDVFISEYIEGSSNNKAIEIYNGTAGPIDLAAAGYNLQMYFNGSATPSLTINLAGTVAVGDVFVVAHSSAAASILAQADQTNGSGWYNGDDAIVLRRGTTVVDVIGQVGFDPGTEWGTGLVSTADNTLRRMAGIGAGDTNGGDGFAPATEWDGYANDTFDGLGVHTSTGCNTLDVPPVVAATVPINGTSNVATNTNLTITFAEPVTVTANWAQVSCSSSGVQSVGTGALDVTGGPSSYNLNPATDFASGETCTATVYAAQVADQDGTPDNLASDYTWSFGTAADVLPAVSATTPANGAVNVALASPLVVSFSEVVDLAPGAVTLVCDGNPLALSGLPANDVDRVTLTPAAALPAGVSCSAVVVANLVSDNDGLPHTMASDYAWAYSTVSSGPTRIHAVQGTTDISPLAGQTVTLEGVVVGDFQSTIGSFFVQEEDADADTDPLTSEGILVYSTIPVNVGDRVSVSGVVTEYYNETEIGGSVAVTVLSSGNPLPGAASVTLPVAAVSDWERYEGMRVSFPQSLYVSETYLLGRGGMLSLADQRIYQPTHLAAPGAPALAVAAENARHSIILDDGSQAQNTDPIRWPSPGGLSAGNLVRNGYQVSGVQGVVTYRYHGWSGSLNAYRIYPTADPAFVPANPRTTSPAPAGTLRVASFNVLNYFNGNGSGGGFPTARGAESLTEFNRQRAKIIAAILGLDADVIGLMEIENDGYASASAIQDLVNGLNAAAGAGTYRFIDPGVTNFGGDEIAVGMLYRPASVTPVGTTAFLATGAFIQGTSGRNRQPLAQTFEGVASGERFTVVVNHFKSKGSDCATAAGGFPADPDLGDGQGNCNLTRTMAAQDLIAWLATHPTGIADPDVIVIGDLNAYAQEDPITAFRNAGYIDLPNAFLGLAAYSYVFDGQLGYLDHALASPSLAAQVTAAGEWHINADEPTSLDYNTNFKTTGQVTSLYAADAYRASDHDPVVIDLFMPYGRADLSDLASGYGFAWHRRPHNAWLGASVDDDLSFTLNDDNFSDNGPARGVQHWLPGETISLTVQVGGSGPAWLAAWFDWNGSGAFENGELNINRAVGVGGNLVTVTVPMTAIVANSTLAVRFRLYESATEPATLRAGDTIQSIRASVQDGGVTGGEVEDYLWDFGPTAVKLRTARAAPGPAIWLLLPGIIVLLGAAIWFIRRRLAQAL